MSFRAGLSRAAAACVSTAIALATMVGIETAPEVAARPNAPLVPSSGALLGAWMERDHATTMTTKKAMWESRERELGRRYDIVNRFYPFTSTFPTWGEQWDLDLGRIPSISWAGADTLAVNAGTHDALIRARAQGVAGLDGQVFMRWFWEADGAYQLPIAHTPADFIAAWKRVRRIFIEEGATNAVWTWCGTAWGFTTGNADAWYPGDDEVDWVCANGYNWAPVKPRAPWDSWEKIYRPAHDFAIEHDKPLMAGEWGALERNPGEKAAWLDAARATIKTSMPNMAALVAFDEERYESRYDLTFDWEVDSSASAQLAFVRMARDPHFTVRTAATMPMLDVSDARIWEGNTGNIVGRVPVTLSTPTHEDVSFRFRTLTGSAGAGDFVAVDRTVHIRAGGTRAEVSITLSGDIVNENRESFRFVISDPVGAVIGDSTGQGVLFDDDPASAGVLHVMAGDLTVTEGVVATRAVRIPITLTAARSSSTTIAYRLLPWTVNTADYAAAASGTIVIPAGQRQGSVAITIRGDVATETNEALFVELTSTSAGTITDGLGVLTIRTDD